MLWKATLFIPFVLVLAQSARGAVELLVFETDHERPVACRVHLKDAQGKAVQPPGLPFWRDHFVFPGKASLQLAAGKYTYEIERGPEYQSMAGALEVPEGEDLSIMKQLKRLADVSKEGWWSGELHVHRPLADVELLMRAEDLHVAPVITWWNNMNFWKDRPKPERKLIQFDRDRFYHVMGGEDERNGGALLYFNLNEPLSITGANREYPSPVRFLNEARTDSGVWVDIEKPFWNDVPAWLASGKANSIGIANNHMHRRGMYPNEAWGRTRDTQRLPAPHGNGYWTQEIYYHALNCGLRLTPSAGSASGVLPNPVGYNRVYSHLEGELTYEKWWQGLREGKVFVSNGPLLRVHANGKLPGTVFTTPRGGQLACKIDAKLDSRDPVREVQLIKNGKVERSIPPGAIRNGVFNVEIPFDQSGWFLVRALADVPNTFRFASTGPFYVEVGDSSPRISKSSAQFFLDWTRERIGRINLDSAEQMAEVLAPHRQAEKFWEEKVRRANAE